MLGYSYMPSHFQSFPTRSHPNAPSFPYHLHSGIPSYGHRSDVDAYYEYLDAIRSQRELAELEQVQSRRRAQEVERIAARREYESRLREEAKLRSLYDARIEAQHRRRAQFHRMAQTEARDRDFRRKHTAQVEDSCSCNRCQTHVPNKRASYPFAAAEQQQTAHEALNAHAIWKHIQEATKAAAESSTGEVAPFTFHPISPPSVTVQPESPVVRPLPSPRPAMTYTAAVCIIQKLAKKQLSIRRQLRSVHALRLRFGELRKVFAEPDALIFDAEKSTSLSPVLAYSPANRPLLAYEESLSRLLIDLDAIVSGGSERVRADRKALAVAIEAELSRLEALRLQAWQRQQADASFSLPISAEATSVGNSVQEADASPALSASMSEAFSEKEAVQSEQNATQEKQEQIEQRKPVEVKDAKSIHITTQEEQPGLQALTNNGQGQPIHTTNSAADGTSRVHADTTLVASTEDSENAQPTSMVAESFETSEEVMGMGRNDLEIGRVPTPHPDYVQPADLQPYGAPSSEDRQSTAVDRPEHNEPTEQRLEQNSDQDSDTSFEML
ncbi:MAG: hypothetical protein CYPHOPRED_000908 [Cyphobasidiales sp. Tagirdzhanova-0007]|nr:MAG: hypothetical protein CYPHOPRED_000908 [Cyphobasidiales sp. Tagirdzhanova-0007]